MSNVRGKITCLEALAILLRAYTANDFQTYCKGIVVNRPLSFAQTPDAQTPCIILNDGGEEFIDAGVIGDGTSQTFAKIRIHKVELTVIEHYLENEGMLIGDATSVGIIDFSHLVELAFLSSKTISTDYKFLAYDPWKAVDISDSENPNLIVACGRQTVIAYKTVPEVV